MTMMIHHHETLELNPDTKFPDSHQDTFSKTYLGFWMYLMSDCLLFATLFCTYAVLHHETFGGPTSRELFDLSTAFIETMILLFSSFTCGFAMLSALKDNAKYVLAWLGISFLLGATFILMERHEFVHLLHRDFDWTRSAFLSSFFALVGTHGLHVTVGLFWMIVMMGQVYWTGINVDTFRRLAIFSLFWHFLDLIWIFIFTFVYLIGVI